MSILTKNQIVYGIIYRYFISEAHSNDNYWNNLCFCGITMNYKAHIATACSVMYHASTNNNQK